ncbi:hypothetical protein [Sphingomonas sp.]
MANTPVLAFEAEAERAGLAQEQRRQKAATPKGKSAPIGNFFSRLSAAMDEEWMLPQLARAIDRGNPEADPGYWNWYLDNRMEIEGLAQSPREVQALRETRNRDDLEWVRKDIERSRANQETLDATGNGTAFSLLAGLSDPVGWAAGAGMGKAFQVAGVGSRVLAAGGNKAGAVASLGAESALGNVAFTGLLDAAGRTTTSEDYWMSAGMGLGIGLGLSPVVIRGAGNDAAADLANRLVRDAEARQGRQLAQAAQNLGEGATPEQIAGEAMRIDAAEHRDLLKTILADIPDSERLLHHDPDQLLTADPKVKGDIEKRYGLNDSISDGAERNLVAEHLARAEAIVEANPIDQKALKTVLAKAGMESTGTRLLASESPVAKAVGLTLLESATGAGGRRRTAALTMHTRERMYNRAMHQFDALYHNFRKGEGVGMVEDFVTGNARKRFNDRVFDEVEARMGQPEGRSFDTNPFVVEAADHWERGMNMMRKEMQYVDAVGAARLGMTSRGYMTHRLDARKVLGLTPKQRSAVRAELQAQFVGGENGFDAKFAKKLATKYLERAYDAAKGGYDVPMNLRSPEAADIVRDALKAMNIEDAEVDKLMGKFSRGGAAFTKRRLRLNLKADLGDGMVLRDLFNTDISGMYRSYARRAAGEVALAQYGIMGKKGLNELRKAISETGGTADDLKAFDQIAAEFLNTPFGAHNHKYMDNIRTATSAARLGGMGFTQFAEYGNAMAALGVQRTFAAIAGLPRLAREVGQIAKGGEAKNPILKSIDALGGHLGLDDYQLQRWWDVKDNDIQVYSSENIGMGTRALRAAGHMQASLTGFRMIAAVQTRGMAEQIVRKAMQFVRDGKDSVALADMGISPDLAARLRSDLDNIATFGADGKLRDLDLLKSKLEGADLMAFRDAVERGASQIIQRTYIGETGKWAHDGFLKMLAQFRTFSVTAVEKQWGRGVRNYGAIKSAMYLMGAMSFAAPIHLARVHLKMTGMSRSEREKYAEQNLGPMQIARATLNYASASGLLGDIIDVGGGFASSFGGDGGEEMAAQIGVRGTKGQSQLVGGVFAPGVGLVEDVWDGIHGDGKKIAKALPGANHPLAQPIINAISAE